MITVTIKCSTGSNFSISVEPSNTIGEFKQLLVEKSSIPKEQQRLIYSGHVLKDQQTVESYSIKDGHTVHLVRGASNNTAAQARTVPVNTTTPSPSLNSPLIPPNIGGFGGFGLGNQNLQQMQQQLMQNPETMRELLNSPIMQSLMSNPELMRSMLMNDPQMREVIERNPEVGHILNDPQILRQSMELARNPELMREMMRNTDRAMSNIESHPEGFNLLRRMYTNVQEPLQNATQLGQNSNPTIGNPVNQSQTSSPQPSAPNTNPLPNPWGTPSVNPTQASSSNPLSNPPTSNPFGTMPGMPGMPDMNMINSMLQNPQTRSMMHTMMQQMFSNPEFIQQMQSNPMIQSMMNSNPAVRQMFQNPEYLQQLSNPDTLNALFQMQNSLQQLQSTGFFNPLNPTPNQTSRIPPTSSNPFDFSQMFSMMNSSNPPVSSQVQQDPPEVRFREQIEQLKEMGFTDVQANILALTATNGNVQQAIDRLLGSL